MAIGTGGAGSIGTVFVELDLDPDRYTKGQQRLYKDATQTALNIEANFKKLNIKSSAEFDLMRQKITNAYNMIAHSSKATANDILRAEKAKNDQLKEINRQQYGEQTGFIEKIKKNWMAASVAIVAAIMAINKAVQYMELGAAAKRSEAAFRVIAENSGMAADDVIKNMQRATKNVINSSDMMQKAIKLISFDYTAEQIERFSNVIETAALISGTKMADAFNRLADSIASRMPRAMYEMGAVTRDQMDIVQRAISAGAESTVFFELAMANLELQQLRLQGTQEDTILQLERYRKNIVELKEETGKVFISIFNSAIDAVKLLAAGINGITGNVYNLISAYYKYRAVVYDIIGAEKKADDNRVKAWIWQKKSLKEWEERDKLYNEVKKSILGLSDAEGKASEEEINNARKRVEAQIEALKKLIETRKTEIKERKKQAEVKLQIDKEEKKQVKDYTQEIDQLYKNFLYSHAAGYAEMSKSAQTGYEETQYYAKRSLDFHLQLFRNTKKEMLALGWTEEDWQAWYNARAFEAEIKSQEIILQGLKNLMKYSDDAKTGIQAYYKELELSVYTWSQAAYDNVKNFAETSKTTLSTIFFDASTGDLKKFGDYWTSFMNSMKKKWADSLAEMLIQWIMFQAKTKIFKIFGSIFGGGGGGEGITKNALGNVFYQGQIKKFGLGDIITKPTYLPLGLFGENPNREGEAIMPLKRTKTGELGVQSTGPTLSISIPITINGGFNKRMVSDLRSDIEDLVERKVRAWV